ncbi:MAG TPA: hypothetical protein VGW38_16595, partial [Chloroflexota bacterium]|nr:hypothetical protein [Chloroflexota bacterium]
MTCSPTLRRALLAVLLPTLVAEVSAGQTQTSDRGPHASAPAVHAIGAQGPIELDGRLDEPAWTTATPASEFTQLDPNEGEPASERTEVRVLYDDEALYIGAMLYDSGEVRRRLGRRDAYIADSDWFTVSLDSYHDHLTAYQFR